MPKAIFALTAAGFLALGFVAAWGQAPALAPVAAPAPAQARGLLSVLQVGQQVALTRTSNGAGPWRIALFEAGLPKEDPEGSHCTLREVGSDYVVLQTGAGIPGEVRVPIYAIDSVLVWSKSK